MVGETVSHYKIVSKLGGGGMGVVYKAEDTRLGRHVALKFLPDQLAEDTQALERFRREAQAASALNHPNICTIHDIGDEAGKPFLVMELLEGTTLRHLITSQPMDPVRIDDLAIQIADALDAAHSAGIVHRDIKPANLFITDRGYAKILDFGLAKLTEADSGSESAMPTAAGIDQGLTSPGATVGTIAYMSPEQVRGQVLDARTDLYSFGVVLYEMATGRPPFEGATSGVIFSEILAGRYVSPVQVNPQLPDDLGRIVSKLLEADRDIRYQTARDLLADLKRFRRDTGSDHSVMSHPPVTVGAADPPGSSPSSQVPAGTPQTVDGSAEPAHAQRSDPSASHAQPPTQAPGSSGSVSSQVPVTSGSVVVVHKSGKAPWVIAGLALAGLILLGALWILRPRTGTGSAGIEATRPALTESATNPDRKMIVVLPFENLGSADDEFFAQGVSEEITSRLASVSGIGVISRNSASQYKGTDTPIQQIGDELGVDYVLEGSVRWARAADGTSRVRITPQLIRVGDDTQLWSNTYDRVIEDIFEVQSDIAGKVISQLDVALVGSEGEKLSIRPTDNLEAYQYYLRGLEVWRHPDITQRQFQVSTGLFQRAVEMDPEFAQAHAMLSLGHSRVYWFGADASEKRKLEARAAADRALQINPDLGQGYLALGYVHYYGSRDYDKALEQFEKARALLPGDVDVLAAIGYIYRRQGKLAEAAASFARALELDPRAGTMAGDIGQAYQLLRRHEEAERYYDRAISIIPDQTTAYGAKALNLWQWKGDSDGALAILARMPAQQGTSAMDAWASMEIATREFQSALDRLEAAPFEFFDTRVQAIFPKSLLVGRVLDFLGRTDEATAAYEQALPHMERYVREQPEDAFSHAGLSGVYSGLGRHAEAIESIELAAQMLPLERDAMYGPHIVLQQAVVYTDAGELDLALDKIEVLLSVPYTFTTTSLRLHPAWDALREHPRYREILQNYR